MKNDLNQFPRLWAVCGGMPCGPFVIPQEFCLSKDLIINYALCLSQIRFKGRVIIEWDDRKKKQPTQIYRDKNNNPYSSK